MHQCFLLVLSLGAVRTAHGFKVAVGKTGNGLVGIATHQPSSGGIRVPSYMTEKIQISRAIINRMPTMVQINPLPRMSFSFRWRLSLV